MPGILPGILPAQGGNLDNSGLQREKERLPQVPENQGFTQEQKTPCNKTQGEKIRLTRFEPVTFGSEEV